MTCAAYDSLGIKIPEQIIFVRRDEFGGYHELTANGKLYFTKRTEGRHSHALNCFASSGDCVSFLFPLVLDLVNKDQLKFGNDLPDVCDGHHKSGTKSPSEDFVTPPFALK